MNLNADEFKELIGRELELRRIRKPDLSLRGFANRLGLSSSALSELLSGKRKFSEKKRLEVLQKLGYDQRPEPKAPSVAFSEAEFKVLSHWRYYALLSFLEGNPRASQNEMVQAIDCKPLELKEIIRTLVQLNLLKKSQQGSYQVLPAQWKSSDGVVSQAVRSSHLESLQLAEKALLHQGLDERDFTSLTFRMDPADLPRIQKRIREFYRNLESEFEARPRAKVVYRIQTHLFKLTDLKPENLKNQE